MWIMRSDGGDGRHTALQCDCRRGVRNLPSVVFRYIQRMIDATGHRCADSWTVPRMCSSYDCEWSESAFRNMLGGRKIRLRDSARVSRRAGREVDDGNRKTQDVSGRSCNTSAERGIGGSCGNGRACHGSAVPPGGWYRERECRGDEHGAGWRAATGGRVAVPGRRGCPLVGRRATRSNRVCRAGGCTEGHGLQDRRPGSVPPDSGGGRGDRRCTGHLGTVTGRQSAVRRGGRSTRAHLLVFGRCIRCTDADRVDHRRRHECDPHGHGRSERPLPPFRQRRGRFNLELCHRAGWCAHGPRVAGTRRGAPGQPGRHTGQPLHLRE